MSSQIFKCALPIFMIFREGSGEFLRKRNPDYLHWIHAQANIAHIVGLVIPELGVASKLK